MLSVRSQRTDGRPHDLVEQGAHNEETQQRYNNHHQDKSDGIRQISNARYQIEKAQAAPRAIGFLGCLVPKRTTALWTLAGSGRHIMSAVWTGFQVHNSRELLSGHSRGIKREAEARVNHYEKTARQLPAN